MKRKFPYDSPNDDLGKGQGQGLLSSILKTLNSLPKNVFTDKLQQFETEDDVDDIEKDNDNDENSHVANEKEFLSPEPIKNPLNHLSHITKSADYRLTGKAARRANDLFTIQKRIEKLSLVKLSEAYIKNEASEPSFSPSNQSASKVSESEVVLEETMNIESESSPKKEEEEEKLSSVLNSVHASGQSKQSLQLDNKIEEKMVTELPIKKIDVEKRKWTDQETQVFLEFASKLTRSITKKENRGQIHEQINAEFKKKGIDTELDISDIMQRLNEDLIKIKRRIVYKNEKYKHFNSYLALDDVPVDDNTEDEKGGVEEEL